MRMVVISISLSAETLERLEALAYEKRLSMSSLARRLIEEELKKQ